ncbi:MAG: methyl-accepting chemotaxis protein [Thiobacillus sp.]
MRTNLPITNVEYVLRDDEAPTSKTDIHGNITYVNEDFRNISGFSEDELLGQPHNMVRHPDMPVEAFADLWRTLKSGKPWTGIVKNRCKNGDHYWVEANAAPIFENGKIVGYTSVRGKPSRDQVQAAEGAYRAIKAGDKTLEVHEGKAVKRGAFSGLGALKSISLKSVLTLAAVSMALLFVCMGALAWLATTGGGASYLKGLMAIAAAGVPLAGIFGVLAYRSVVLPLERTRQEIDRVSAGDLTGRIDATGMPEMARLMNSLRMLQINLRWVVGQIKESTDFVNAGAHEIASGNADLSGRTESQAASLEETASSMEELTSTVKENADQAGHASKLVTSTSDVAVKGGRVVGQVVETMASIKESSRRIADIIGVIDSIAFQTNILALNAAVEAARAGEQGRGFAVVATEVRNLAQRSASAAKEIKTLIEDSVSKVDAGSKLVDETGEAMDDIVTSVQLVTDIMAGIAAASLQQSAGIDQVNQAVGHMDEITQQNAALVEEAAAASESMKIQADKLAVLVASFKLKQGGATAARRAVTKAMPAPAWQKAVPASASAGSRKRAAVG